MLTFHKAKNTCGGCVTSVWLSAYLLPAYLSIDASSSDQLSDLCKMLYERYACFILVPVGSSGTPVLCKQIHFVLYFVKNMPKLKYYKWKLGVL